MNRVRFTLDYNFRADIVSKVQYNYTVFKRQGLLK